MSKYNDSECTPNGGAWWLRVKGYPSDSYNIPTAQTYPLYGIINTDLGEGTFNVTKYGGTKINVYDKSLNDLWVKNDGHVNGIIQDDKAILASVQNLYAVETMPPPLSNTCCDIYDDSFQKNIFGDCSDKICTFTYSDSYYNNRSAWGIMEMGKPDESYPWITTSIASCIPNTADCKNENETCINDNSCCAPFTCSQDKKCVYPPNLSTPPPTCLDKPCNPANGIYTNCCKEPFVIICISVKE